MKSVYIAFAAIAMISGTAVAGEQAYTTSKIPSSLELLARDGAGGASGSDRTPGVIRSEELRQKYIEKELEKQKTKEQAKV